MPRVFRYGKLAKHPIRPMSLRFRAHTSGARLTVILDEGTNTWPSILLSNQLQSLVLPHVSCKDVIVFELQDSSAEIVGGRNINAAIEAKEAYRVDGPAGSGR